MRINSFIGSLPGYWLLFEAIDLGLYKSKSPDWLGLYSTPKASAIIALFFSSWLAFRFISPRFVYFFEGISYPKKLVQVSPTMVFLILAVLFRLILISVPCTVGEDVAMQTLSAKQWIAGETSAPNLVASPNPSDLSTDNFIWILRPPGAAWFSLPGLILGLPLAYSIHSILFLFALTTGAGWLRLAMTFSIPSSALFFFAVFLSIYTVMGSLILSTASAFTTATFPWLLIWALFIGKQWSETKSNLRIHQLFFFAIIGMHAFFKLSSLLTLSAVVVLPFLIFLSKARKMNFYLFVRASTSALLFLLPYFVLSTINQKNTGVSADELYSKQDYNAQHALWGKHFTESTKGGMLITSLIASTGYATPSQGIIHRFRDLLLQFDSYTTFLNECEINSLILGCCILSIPITLLVFFALRNLKGIISRESFTLYFSLFIVPFLGFALISYHHGYNYLIYHAYTKEFSIIFILFALSYLAHSSLILRAKIVKSFLIAFLLALPVCNVVNSFCSVTSKSWDKQKPSAYEKREGFDSAKFSKSLDLVSKDSKSSTDICFFLCAGDYGDHCLRTDLRSFSLHFAQDNIRGFSNLQSSLPLNLYCLIDPALSTDQSFLKFLLSKIPDSAIVSRLDSLTWKVQMTKVES